MLNLAGMIELADAWHE